MVEAGSNTATELPAVSVITVRHGTGKVEQHQCLSSRMPGRCGRSVRRNQDLLSRTDRPAAIPGDRTTIHLRSPSFPVVPGHQRDQGLRHRGRLLAAGATAAPSVACLRSRSRCPGLFCSNSRLRRSRRCQRTMVRTPSGSWMVACHIPARMAISTSGCSSRYCLSCGIWSGETQLSTRASIGLRSAALRLCRAFPGIGPGSPSAGIVPGPLRALPPLRSQGGPRSRLEMRDPRLAGGRSEEAAPGQIRNMPIGWPSCKRATLIFMALRRITRLEPVLRGRRGDRSCN